LNFKRADLLLFQTGVADTFNPYFNTLDTAGKGLLEIFGVYCQTLRAKTINQAAFCAVKMWMLWMIRIRCYAKISSPSASTYSFKKMFLNKQIEYSVHSHPVDCLGPFNGVENFHDGKRITITTDHLHDE